LKIKLVFSNLDLTVEIWARFLWIWCNNGQLRH